MTIMLNGSDLTVTQVVAVARHGDAVTLAPAAIAATRQARAVVHADPGRLNGDDRPIPCPHAGAEPGPDRCN